METVKRRTGKINLIAQIMLFAALLLGYVSYMQQKSPLCGALSGHPPGSGGNAEISVFSEEKENPLFVINISKGGIATVEKMQKNGVFYKKIFVSGKICHKSDEKTAKNDVFCPVSAENMENFIKNWQKDPKNFVFAAKFFLAGKSELDYVERISLMQALLRTRGNENGKNRLVTDKLKNEDLPGRKYAVEIMNGSGQSEAMEYARKWLAEHGFEAVSVSGAVARQENTEIFAYGSEKASYELKNFFCGNKKFSGCGICNIKIFPEKKSLDAAIVIGKDYRKIFAGQEFPSLTKISKPASKTVKNGKITQKTRAKKEKILKKTAKK